MVVKIILIGFLVTIICIFVAGYIYKEKYGYMFSFEDTIGIVKVPVVSFEHNGKTVNFIIDSGASHSIIDSACIDEFEYKPIESANSTSVRGINGDKVKTALAYVELTSEGHTFSDVFQVCPVPTLKWQEEKYGIHISGLLGSQFLKKYRFLINYKHLNAYTNG